MERGGAKGKCVRTGRGRLWHIKREGPGKGREVSLSEMGKTWQEVSQQSGEARRRVRRSLRVRPSQQLLSVPEATSGWRKDTEVRFPSTSTVCRQAAA